MSSVPAVRSYLDSLRATASAPSTTEYSYRPALKRLIKDLADCLNRPSPTSTWLPGRPTPRYKKEVCHFRRRGTIGQIPHTQVGG